jgi:4-hydroxybutyrate CoA-transferase
LAAQPSTCDIDELPELLSAGTSVYLPGTSGEPSAFLEALQRRPASAAGVRFVTNFVPGLNDFDLLGLDSGCQLTCFFMTDALQKHARSPRLNLVPSTYLEIDRHLRSTAKPDLAIVQVSPPDAHGWCSLGTCVEFNLTALSAARRRIALVNERVPRIARSSVVKLSDFDVLARVDHALASPSTPALDPVATKIAAGVAALIDNGDTVQLGIGKLPAQVLGALHAHRGLRIHSGIAGEEVVGLLRSGAIEGDEPVVCACFTASDAFLRRESRFSWLTVRPVAYTHHPATLARIERLVAINSAVEVDLLGQVNAELANDRRVSGPGGMPDFGPAAHAASGGRSIIALPATAAGGTRSRIVAGLSPGCPVTLPMTAVDYVVTEFGVAPLRGRSHRARAEALIDVAHPDFRAALQESSPLLRHWPRRTMPP